VAGNPLQAIESVKASRLIRQYTLPESLRSDDPSVPRPKTIGMRQLSAEEELMASKIGRVDYMRAQYAATKLSIVEFDGKPIDHGTSALDIFWERSDPKVRSLLLQAYNRLSSPSKEEEDGFFESETAKV
jgi:hypothetical protein